MVKEHIKYTACTSVGTVIYVACDGAYAGCIVIEDEIKADAPAAIRSRNRQASKTVMLTGDADAVGKRWRAGSFWTRHTQSCSRLTRWTVWKNF